MNQKVNKRPFAASEPFPVNRASLNGSMNQENSLRNNSADKENYEEVPNKRKNYK